VAAIFNNFLKYIKTSYDKIFAEIVLMSYQFQQKQIKDEAKRVKELQEVKEVAENIVTSIPQEVSTTVNKRDF